MHDVYNGKKACVLLLNIIELKIMSSTAYMCVTVKITNKITHLEFAGTGNDVIDAG